MKHQDFVDYVKALAIILVVIYHSGIFKGDYVASSILSMCVPFFFSINGYLILQKERDISYFIRKNIKIVVLILFWGTLGSISYMYMIGEEFKIVTLFKHLYNLDARYCNHLWFLFTLFILNIISPIIRPFITKNKRNTIYAILVILCFSLFTKFTWHFSLMKGWHSYALLYYVLGYVIITYYDHIKNNYLLAITIFCIIAQSTYNYIALNLLPNLNLINDMVFEGYKSIFIVISTLSVILYIRNIKLKNTSAIRFISKNTLAIYLLHQPIRNILSTQIHGIQALNILYPLLIGMLTVLLLTFMKKNKLTRYFIEL